MKMPGSRSAHVSGERISRPINRVFFEYFQKLALNVRVPIDHVDHEKDVKREL